MDNSKIKIGFAAHPHGIKGEVELRLTHPDGDAVLQEGQSLWLYPSSPKSRLSANGESWRLLKLRFGNKIIASFEGVRDRTHLEQLLPLEFYLERAAFPETSEGEFYLSDLIGLEVVSESGEALGKLEGLSDNGMQHLFEVRLNTGELLTLPYVESFFPEVDVEGGRIVMVMPDYTE
jgi:16S rRNA processing protein RimM